jgi:hypothetical protein
MPHILKTRKLIARVPSLGRRAFEKKAHIGR